MASNDLSPVQNGQGRNDSSENVHLAIEREEERASATGGGERHWSDRCYETCEWQVVGVVEEREWRGE